MIRKIEKEDKKQLDDLLNIIGETTFKPYWLPISNKSYDNFLNDDWTYFLGEFDGDKLVAASALFFNENEYGETLKICNLKYKNVAEVGRCMVHPDYRGKNFLYTLNEKLKVIAKEKGVKTLIATIHPDNIPSLKSFTKSGFDKVGYLIKYDEYPRNVFKLDI